MEKKIQFSFFAAVVLVAACLVNTAAMPGATNTTVDRHLTGPMYEILGMLGEYISRFDYYTGEPHPGMIEWIYPVELDIVDRFEKLLEDHAQITGLKKDWKKEIGKQGHVRFVSSRWANILNSFYIKIGDRWANSDPSRKNWATLNPAILENASQEEMLRFLQGAYSRFGLKDKSSAIMMANASYKMETIAGVLQRLMCTHITIYVLPFLPHHYQVHFHPSSIVRQKLGIQKDRLDPSEKWELEGWRVFKIFD